MIVLMLVGISFAEEKEIPKEAVREVPWAEAIEIRQNGQEHEIEELKLNICVAEHKEKLRKDFKDEELRRKFLILELEHEKELRILRVKFEKKEYEIRAKYYKKSSLELLKAAKKLGYLEGEHKTLSRMTLKGLLDIDLFRILDGIIDEKIKMLYDKYPRLKELDEAPDGENK
jgi:hypothetical protein